MARLFTVMIDTLTYPHLPSSPEWYQISIIPSDRQGATARREYHTRDTFASDLIAAIGVTPEWVAKFFKRIPEKQHELFMHWEIEDDKAAYLNWVD